MANTKPYAVSPGWRVLLQDVRLNVANVLRRAELPADLFARDKAALSTQEYFRLWRGIEEESGDPKLPLRIGTAISAEAFDPPIFAALCSPELNTALARLSHYKRLIASMALHVDVRDDATTLELEWLDKTAAPPRSLILAELVFFVQLSRMATRTRISPLEARSPELPEHPQDFTEYFGVPVQYGPRPRLLFSAADATRHFLTANEKMWEFFEPELKKGLADLVESATTEERVRAALLELLPSGATSIEAVSKKLGTSARTLQRRLKQEGLSFQSVLDRTRESLAKHYLTTSSMTGAEISFLLGFEDPNSFFRAFQAWTGQTPRSMRETTVH
jgi:AraC-like DNA-binding protein